MWEAADSLPLAAGILLPAVVTDTLPAAEIPLPEAVIDNPLAVVDILPAAPVADNFEAVEHTELAVPPEAGAVGSRAASRSQSDARGEGPYSVSVR